MDPAVVGPATLAISQAVGSFYAFLPKLTEVRRAHADDPDYVLDVRVGEFAALTLSTGVGLIVSYLTKSPIPLAISLLVAIVLSFLYESALRTTGRVMEA